MTMDAMDKVLSRHTYWILKYLEANPGATKTEACRGAMDRNERTVFLRINDMLALGLLEEGIGRSQWNACSLYVSPKGGAMLEHLEAIHTILEASE